MTNGVIKVEDVLKYAIRIENESQMFYKAAQWRATEDSVKTLLKELEAEEVKHEARLSGILVNVKGMEFKSFDRTSLDQLISTADIPENATQEAVLIVALDREEHTRDFYAQILTMTNLDAEVIDVFEELHIQEKGHVSRISSKLAKL